MHLDTCEIHGCELIAQDCFTCHGTGEVEDDEHYGIVAKMEQCWRCKGSGELPWKECQECKFELINEDHS